ncbi:MAG: hypothetical protein GX447_00980 [Elusimicrobia bacterium]|nr:hypothetical protein [Elusimicrobiota bacterium]
MSIFEFKKNIHLVRILNVKAVNIDELIAGLEKIPANSVYYHTHRFLKQHQSVSPEPPNDFAYWIEKALNMKKLSEIVASVNILEFGKLSELKRKYIEVIKENTTTYERQKKCAANEEFVFMGCNTFIVSTGQKAENLSEFYEKIKFIESNSIYFHIFESRLRLDSNINDFQSWMLENKYGKIAEEMGKWDPYNMTVENLRNKILNLIRKHI